MRKLGCRVVGWITIFTGTLALGEVVVKERRDYGVSISGTLSPRLKFEFAESHYIGANLLDSICLLRYPSGEYSPVIESVVVDPKVHGDTYEIRANLKNFDGSDVCQLQFVAIKLWLSWEDPATSAKRTSYVSLVKEGSSSGNQNIPPATQVTKLVCEQTKCYFLVGLKSTPFLTVHAEGLDVQNLPVELR